MTEVLTQQQAKDFARLHDRKHRAVAGQLLLEGERLVEDALLSARQLRCLVVEGEKEQRYAHIIAAVRERGTPVLRASARNTVRLSDTPHPQGIFAVIDLPSTDPAAAIAAAPLGRPLFALHGIADPGNLGTIARSTEWFGGGALLVSEGSVDVFNSKVVRGSMGSLLRLHIGVYPDFDWLARAAVDAGRVLSATAMEGGRAPADFEHPGDSLVLLGGEAHGLPAAVMERIPERISIPGGGAESLNIAIAHAVLSYAFSLT
ncbi:MAG: RNA methyltransferase [Bacteroidota bacterium]|nr:RNA methyltransferase [Bacteroidota bacterium]